MKRNIKKIEVNFNEQEAQTEAIVYLLDSRVERVVVSSSLATGYTLFNSFKCLGMLDIKINYYDLGFREKNILCNLSVIKKSNDFKNGFIFLSTDCDIYSQNEAFIIANNKIIG